MSFGTQKEPGAVDTTGQTTISTTFLAYVIPVLVIVGVFIMIGIGKLNAETGIAVVSVIAGVHGGATITNAAKP